MQIVSRSARSTLKIGKAIAGYLQGGDIVCLVGELGSGKTIFAKGIASGLNINSEEIISPTFVFIRQYGSSRLPLFHFDLYRIKDEKEILIEGRMTAIAIPQPLPLYHAASVTGPRNRIGSWIKGPVR